MTLPEVLASLENHGVDLRVRGDCGLVLTGAIAELPSEVVGRVRDLKPVIVDLIAAAEDDAAELPHKAEGTLYLASYGQSRLAFIDRLDPLSTAYNVTATVVVTGRCETGRLARAFSEVANSHPASRTCLARIDDVDVSVVGRRAALDLPVCDLSDLPEPSRSHTLRALRDAISRTRFDLERPPLVSWTLVRLSSEHHELVVALHHYACDGWSLVRSLRAASALLTGDRNGVVSAPCTGPGSYADYARRQRAACRTSAAKVSLEAWRARLEGFCHPIQFPFESRRQREVGGSAGGRLAFGLDLELGRCLRSRAVSLRCTIGTLLTGVFALTLARTSGTDRFVIGMAASDRPDKSFEDTFGFFVNWLPLRVDFSHSPTFAAFLADFHQERLSALADVHIPFDQIVQALGGERRVDKHPLFQFMFVSHVPARGVRMGELTASIDPLFSGSAKLDLTMFFTDARGGLAVADGDGDIHLEIEYASVLFDAATIEGFAQTFLEIATELAADPTRPIAVRAQVDRGAIAHGARVAHGRSPLLDIASVAKRTPEAPALQGSGETWTYRRLCSAAARVAEDLARLDIGKGDRVCALQARGPEAIAGMLGSMLVGAVFTPFDISNPDARLNSILAQARPGAILASDQLRGRAQRLAGNVPVLVPAGLADDAAAAWDRRLAHLQEGDAAYLLFTSGSTGRPKGVLGGHAQLANFCDWLGRYLALTCEDVILCKTSPSFDASFRETIAPLAVGARLEIVEDAEAADTAALLRALHRSGATVLHATPTLQRDLLLVIEQVRRECLPEGALPALRVVMCGGENLDATLAADHSRLLPHCALYNVYGPTECTVDVTAQDVRVGQAASVVPIGWPIQNVSLAILDEHLCPVPAGREGEIAIAGRAVGLGYWPDPTDATAPKRQCFWPARQLGFEVDTDAFLTGDYGVLQPDGSILFRGRRDRQVQIGGLRTELDEIENVLLGVDHVAQAAVLHRAGQGPGHLIAFVEPRPGHSPLGADDLRAALLERLPVAMIPATIVVRERLPRLVTGKIDRKALEITSLIEPNPVVLSPQEQAVLRLMQELLGDITVSPSTSFFAQGGHSLNAVRFVARANREFGRSLTIKDFFANPTVIGFARRLASAPLVGELDMAVSRAQRPRHVPNG
ncbi:amino acid adenylation domain-containing protein [Mesorhizobium sp. M0618]|uniref:non-ribosomal peptide synthetase n=1 Tax=unclassified Mesorhizobium TaxID=325217 RepID=UPI00333DF1E0